MLTEEQLKARKSGIGGSEAAAICGLSRYRTPLDVYTDKLSDNISQEPTPWQLDGHELEPENVKRYANLKNKKVTSLPLTRKGIMIANVDGFIESDNRVLEIKNSLYKTKDWGEPGTDEVPTEYLLQVAHYCEVLDADGADIYVYFKALGTREVYVYNKKPDLQATLKAKEINFWNEHVLKEVPPPPLTSRELNQHSIFEEGKAIEIKPAVDKSISELITLKNKIISLKQSQEALEKQIKEELSANEAEFLINSVGETRVSWKRSHSSRFDSKVFAQEHPDLYQQYLKQTSSRRLLIK